VSDRVHDLKVWPEFFDALADRSKTFELRPDDRGIEAGDWLLLSEWDPTDAGIPRVYEPKGYTGRKLVRWVTYVLRGPDAEKFGLQPGFCVLALARDETEATR
jgi:hypothetical protein